MSTSPTSTKRGPTVAPSILLRGVPQGLPHSPALSTREVSWTPTTPPLAVGPSAREGGAVKVAVPLDDVVRVEFDEQLVLWMRTEDLLRERGTPQVNRSDGEVVWDIDTAARPAPLARVRPVTAERGLLKLGIRALEFFGIDVAQGAAHRLAGHLEARQLGQPPGLYRVSLGDVPGLRPLADGESIAGGRPVLVFLHGTMSRCLGSFGKLWPKPSGDGADAARGRERDTDPAAADDADGDDQAAAAEARSAFAQHYGDEVYAFEHLTLTRSPIQNALDLVERLPAGAQLHLVSHSRGGLVGELLCLGERERRDADPLAAGRIDALFGADRTIAEQLGLSPLDTDAAAERNQAYATDRAALRALVAALDEKKIRVPRFVRVACPARGTTLASGRLDRWLNALDLLVPEGLFDDSMDFLLAVLKERTDPRTLPGIEAMMPGSALTRLLHDPALTTRSDLSVIAGDIEGKGRWDKLKLLVVDWFYSSEHDLVVNTGSMLGGLRRVEGSARFRRDQGERVNHFNYFRNGASIQWLADGLLRPDGQAGGFLPIVEARPETPRWRSAVDESNRSARAPRPLALLIPGTMASVLSVGDRAVWLKYLALLEGGLGDIGIGASGVEASGLLDDFYGPLLEHLSRTHRVEIFPYDWRLSVSEAARALVGRLQALLPEQELARQPVHLVAHSMGGIVARTMIADGDEGTKLWARITALPDSRLLMLGTPNLGSHEAVRWLVGANPSQAKLTLLDVTRGVDGIIDLVRRYPGLAELLPFDHTPNPWGDGATWAALKAELGASWPLVDDGVLRDAALTWSRLRAAPPDTAHMVYVAGDQPATVIGFKVVEEGLFRKRRTLKWLATGEGDGTVSWASGRLGGVPTYYAPDTAHDELCSNDRDRNVFRGYVDLLVGGRTDQLKDTPPGRARGEGEAAVFELPDLPVVDDLPDAGALRSLGLGGVRPHARRQREPLRSAVIKVSVRHGDLGYARHPVLAGHYSGDTIISAEAALDARLRGDQPVGPLTRQRDLGLYPGPCGTHAVFFNELPGRKPDGAVLVGLGQVGELSPGRLELGVRDAMLDYALRLLQREALRCHPLDGVPTTGLQARRLAANISALLVGTGATSLTVRDSIEAVLRGVLAANRKLEDNRLDQRVLIQEVEFVELFEDVAITAAKDLAVLMDDAGEFAGRVEWPRRVVEPGDGRRRRSSFRDDPGWWQRIEIIEDRKAERLRFTTIADRARAEETLAAGQLRLADRFIAQACGSARRNADVSKTLFEMLLPNRLKESAPDQRDIVLLVDEASARFPWELLEDRWSRLDRPPAVESGMVRQLKTAEFRARPASTPERSVFVVGNPSLDGWAGFVDLPGARSEAQQVAQVLGEARYDVTCAIDKPAETILDGLHAGPWRVLHLAGHGEHDFEIDAFGGAATCADPGAGPADGPACGPAAASDGDGAAAIVELPDGGRARRIVETKRVSGMVIGKNTFLTPGDVDQMRFIPELVFINCCHLGKTGGESAKYNRLAANLGVQFIRMGVRAVVCAGWAVDDAAAATFAKTFYRRLLAGASFGMAVKAARADAWARHAGSNTWGAYQCYGDPDYRLVRAEREPPRKTEPAYVSPSEFVTDLYNLVESTRMDSRQPDTDDAAVQKALRQRLEGLFKRVPRVAPGERGDWMARADVAAAIGFVYGEGYLFDEAIEWLDRAGRAADGDCPVRCAEQRANYQSRAAASRWLLLRSAGAGDDHDQCRPLFAQLQDAREAIGVICEHAPTAERHALLGSACRRLALMQQGRTRLDALYQMACAYRRAVDFGPGVNTYHFVNWALACLLFDALQRAVDGAAADPAPWRDRLRDQMRAQTLAAQQALDDDPTFWRQCGLADLQVLQLLMQTGDAAAVEPLQRRAIELFRAAQSRGASLRELASVRENLDFLVDLTREEGAGWSLPLRAALGKIRAAL